MIHSGILQQFKQLARVPAGEAVVVCARSKGGVQGAVNDFEH